MDHSGSWWAILLTWRFWGPLLGGILFLAGIAGAVLFLLRGDVTSALWVLLFWIVAILLAALVSRVLGARG